MFPPILLTNNLLIYKPRPEPFNSEFSMPSICVNGSNMASNLDSEIPILSSLTLKLTTISLLLIDSSRYTILLVQIL